MRCAEQTEQRRAGREGVVVDRLGRCGSGAAARERRLGSGPLLLGGCYHCGLERDARCSMVCRDSASSSVILNNNQQQSTTINNNQQHIAMMTNWWWHGVTRRHQVVPLAAAKARMKASFAMLMGLPAAEVRFVSDDDDVAPTDLVSEPRSQSLSLDDVAPTDLVSEPRSQSLSLPRPSRC